MTIRANTTTYKASETNLEITQIEKAEYDERPWKIFQKQNATQNTSEKTYLSVEYENKNNVSRWYRISDKNCPGIVIDSGQKKHIYGDLFGHYQGKRESMFNLEDCSPKALKEILDSTLQDNLCEHLHERPIVNDQGICICKSITVDMGKYKYPKVTIQDPIFIKKSDAWYFHFYPEKY